MFASAVDLPQQIPVVVAEFYQKAKLVGDRVLAGGVVGEKHRHQADKMLGD
jgi:hypothetical protein